MACVLEEFEIVHCVVGFVEVCDDEECRAFGVKSECGGEEICGGAT